MGRDAEKGRRGDAGKMKESPRRRVSPSPRLFFFLNRHGYPFAFDGDFDWLRDAEFQQALAHQLLL